MGTKKCSKCGKIKSLDSFIKDRNRCLDCKKIYDKEYNANHFEIISKNHHEWREKNKDKMMKYHKQYAIDNQEKIKKYRICWYIKNKNDVLKRTKQYQKDNKEKIHTDRKIYREKNKEKIRINAKLRYETDKEKIAQQQKIYREQNKDKIREYANKNRKQLNKKANKRAKKYREEMTDLYIIRLINSSLSIRLQRENIPNEIIELYRANLMLKREIKNFSQGESNERKETVNHGTQKCTVGRNRESARR